MKSIVCECGQKFDDASKYHYHLSTNKVHRKPLLGEAKLTPFAARKEHYSYKGYIIYEGKAWGNPSWRVIRPDGKQSQHEMTKEQAEHYVDKKTCTLVISAKVIKIGLLKEEKKELLKKIRALSEKIKVLSEPIKKRRHIEGSL